MISVSYYLLLLALLIPSSIVYSKEPIIPIDVNKLPQLSPQKIQLGNSLFNEILFAKDKSMSCATCHILSEATTDGLPGSLDNQGKPLPYNTPSVNYVYLNYYFAWNGRFSSLKQHFNALVTNKRIFNNSIDEVALRLTSAGYLTAFQEAGYDGINSNSILDALVVFQRSLITPSRFDLYLLGDKTQLSDVEINGYILFKDYGCISCHQGKNIGGNLRQTIGARHAYYGKNNPSEKPDFGYYNITKDEYDKFSFRVPSLRNVARTAPYLHDGSVDSLKEVIELMAYYQLDIDIPEQDTIAIKAFLKTLSNIDE